MIDPDTTNPDEKVFLQLQRNGSDLESPMVIDFHFLCPTEVEADRVHDELVRRGFIVKLYKPGSHQRYKTSKLEPDGEWLIECMINMQPNTDNLYGAYSEIEEALQGFDVKSSGWATSGNNFSDRSAAH